MYTMEYYLAIKKNDIMQHGCTLITILSEVSQIEKEKYIYDISCIWNLRRNNTNKLIYKTDFENKCMVPSRGRMGGGIIG